MAVFLVNVQQLPQLLLLSPQRFVGLADQGLHPAALGDLVAELHVGRGQLGRPLPHPLLQLLMRRLERLFRRFAGRARPQRGNPVGQVVGQVGQQGHLLLVEGVRFAGVDRDRAQHAPLR